MVPVTTNPVYSYTVFFFRGNFQLPASPKIRDWMDWGIEDATVARKPLHVACSCNVHILMDATEMLTVHEMFTELCVFSVSSWYLHLLSPAILVNWFQSFWRVLEVLDVLLFFLCFCVMVFIWSLQTGGQITIQKIQGHWKDLGSGSLCQVAGRGKECQSQILDDEIPRRCVFPCWVNCISTVWLDLRKTSV